MRFVLLFLILLSTTAIAKPQLNPFQSDGCSRWPDGSIFDSTLWKNCCFEHDVHYWMGGTEEERLAADEGLRQCVGNKVHMMAGWVMYSGVRIGGDASYETPYRWGYGWNYQRGYGRLTLFEKKMAENELNKSCLVDGEENEIIDRVMKKKRLNIDGFRKMMAARRR